MGLPGASPARRSGAEGRNTMRPGGKTMAGSRTRVAPQRYRRIYAVVRHIPRGRVATYGQVAALAGYPGQARQVGYALYALPEGSAVPWQRVINARGEVSPRAVRGWAEVQRRLLAKEGILFDARGRIDLDACRWDPDAPRGVSRRATLRAGPSPADRPTGRARRGPGGAPRRPDSRAPAARGARSRHGRVAG